MSELKLGKMGSVNTEQIKAGIKREQIKDSNLETIFDSIDANKDGVIDADEMKQFKDDIANTAGNDKLSKREARKYLKQNNINVNKKDLLKFIDQLSQSSENIESSTVTESNGKKIVHIKYKDGTTETINPDKSSEMASQGENGETIVKYYDKNKNLTSQKTVDTEGNTEVTTYDDSGKPEKTETTVKGGNPVITVNYEDGEPAASTVKDGTTLSEYVFDEAGEPVLTRKTENKGIPAKEKTTDYTYNEDGTTTAVITENGKVTTQTIKDKAVISETVNEGNKTTQTNFTENGKEEVITEGNTVTKNTYNADNKRLSQEQTVDGQTFTVEYDGNGNTKGVVVQNGESPAAIAKKFGVSVEDLLAANPEAVKGKGSNKYFLVGADIKIPGEMDAAKFAKLNAGRQTKEQAVAGYQAVMDEIREVKEEVAARKPISFTNKDYDTYEEMAKALFKREGIANPSKRRIKARIEDLKKTNPDIKDGELKGKRIKANVSQDMHDRLAGKEKSAKEFKQNLETRKHGEAIAKKFYQIADDNSGLASMRKMQELLDKDVTADNILAVLDAYDKDSIKHRDSSIIDTVTSEVGAGGTIQQKKVLTTIMDKLCDAAKKAGVSDGDIQHARNEFMTSMNKEMNAALRRTNPKDMEKAVDFLRGAIVAKKNGGTEMSDADAIARFNADFAATDADVQKQYADAREAEGWTAKVGDTVCGWFGCTTIEDMDAKLGKNAADVKLLAASADNEVEFKRFYKNKVFGVEFDKNKIAARDTALANYQKAQNLSSTINITSGILKKAGSLDYAGLRNEVKSKFQYDDNTLDSIIQGYADNLGVKISTDAEKQEMLTRFLQETQSNAAAGYRDATKGKTIEQMGKDLDLLTKSAFGTNDIVKDFIQFNENEQIIEMVTEAAFEITGTVALQFVPGLGQLAAARLAVSAAKWGSKAVKVANYVEKAFSAADKIQKGTQFSSKVASRAAQVGTQMANAGAATMAVDLSDGKSVKDATKKALMNMSFAGVGAGSSMLAPKLVQTFGMSNALATEVAEEIINAAGSYGITKLEGGEYGKQDAFIDFASGLIMSRISHVKTSGAKSAADGVDLTPPTSNERGVQRRAPETDGAGAGTRSSGEADATGNGTKAEGTGDGTKKTGGTDEAGSKKQADETGSTDGANKADDAKRAEEARNAEEARRADEAKKAEEARQAEEARRADEAKKAEEARQAEEARRAQEQAGPTTEERISQLEQEIKSGEVAENIKSDYADVLDDNFNVDVNNPAQMKEFKSKIRQMMLKAHPDKGGSDKLSQAINDIFHVMKKNPSSAQIKVRLKNLKKVLDEQSMNLNTKRAELDGLKAKAGEAGGAQKSEKASGSDGNKKADDAKPSDDASGAQKSDEAKAEPHTPTPEERMAMGQIGNNINRAKTLADLEKAQAWLNKMPDCDLKTHLQKQLDEKIANLKGAKADGNADSAGGGQRVNTDSEPNSAGSAKSADFVDEAKIREMNIQAQKDKLSELERNFQSQISTVSVNGKNTKVKVFKGSQQGSNAGYWMQDLSTGELSYVKFPPKGRTFRPEIEEKLYGKSAQAKSEALAADLYRAAGFKSPEIEIVTDAFGNVGTKSKFMGKLDTPTAENIASIREGFAADCWLANWDAMKDGNLMMQGGQAIRTDVGGSLCYRARGARKGTAFGENVNELTSFFSSNSLSAKYLQGMSRDELINSLKHVTTIDDKTIASIVKKAEANGITNPEFMKEMLIERRNYMERFQKLCEANPQKSGESIADYVQRMQDATPKTTYNTGKANFDEIPLSSRIYSDINDYDDMISEINRKSKLSEHLTPSQKRIFEASYEALESTKGRRIRHNANNILTSDNMLHATNPKNLESILQDGLVSREYSGVASAKRHGRDSGSMTPMCADLWDVQDTYSIDDYFSAGAKHWGENRGETNFLPNPWKRKRSIVIVFNKKAVDPTIMNNSFKVSDRTSPLYKDGNMGGYKDYTSHRAVPVGLPSNAIDRIIIPDGYSSSMIKDIQNKIKNSGLDIKLYDTNGNQIKTVIR